MSANIVRIHSSIAQAAVIASVGEVVVSAKWKQTANQTSKERAVVVPKAFVQASEVPEQFRALVESALQAAAQEVLKTHVNSEGDSCFEIPEAFFHRQNLVESFMQRGDAWMSKEQLEISFTASATWKRISSREEFKSNATYQRAAQQFKDAILKLSGKAAKLQPEMCDALLSKLEDSDLSSEFGCFVVKRLEQIRKAEKQEFDLSAL